MNRRIPHDFRKENLNDLESLREVIFSSTEELASNGNNWMTLVHAWGIQARSRKASAYMEKRSGWRTCKFTFDP